MTSARLGTLRRALCMAATAVGAWLSTPAVAATTTPEPATVTMRTAPVADGTWFVQGESALGSAANQNFISNAAFVVTPAGVLVIDALGSPPLAQALVERIRAHTDRPIRWVVVTHCHADHLYGLQVFQALGARIVAHTACREYLHSETAAQRLAASRVDLFPWVDEQTRLVEPDTWIGDADAPQERVLTLGDRRFVVRHAGPSHTAEDLVVFDETTRVLFAGDIVFRGRVPFVGQADSRRWIDVLDRLLEWRPSVIVPGHGPLSRTPADDLRTTRDYLAWLRATMGPAARAMEPFEEAYARTDWSRFAHLPLFQAANRINAYNTYLLMEREP